MAQDTYGRQIAMPPLPMEAGGEIPEPEVAGEQVEEETGMEMEAHPNEVKFYADMSQKFSEIAAIIADHGKWHESLGKK